MKVGSREVLGDLLLIVPITKSKFPSPFISPTQTASVQKLSIISANWKVPKENVLSPLIPFGIHKENINLPVGIKIQVVPQYPQPAFYPKM
jgi:hypothetical protein